MEHPITTQPTPSAEDHVHESHDGVYILTFVLLVALTLIEVLVTYVPGLVNLVLLKALVLILLASGKAALVVAFFMHLRYEKRYLPLVFIGPIIAAVLAILALNQLVLR